MEIRDWIMISAAVIVVGGWFVNGYLNRLHEIAKKRMEYRLEMLHSFLPVFFSIQRHKDPFVDDVNLLQNLEASRSKFLIYGNKDEIEIFESIVKAIESENVSSMKIKLIEMVTLVKKRIRIEIGVDT